jgi:DNA-directed RNA polymerase subunit M/transcription elongation factor TFIIS
MDSIIQKHRALIDRAINTFCETDEERNEFLYEAFYMLSQKNPKKQKVSELVNNMRTYGSEFVWHQTEFDSLRETMKEETDFQMNAIDFEEGVLECVCGSKKTISFQKQTRSADEGSTTFAKCVQCKRTWRHNN